MYIYTYMCFLCTYFCVLSNDSLRDTKTVQIGTSERLEERISDFNATFSNDSKFICIC